MIIITNDCLCLWFSGDYWLNRKYDSYILEVNETTNTDNLSNNYDKYFTKIIDFPSVWGNKTCETKTNYYY